MKRKRRKRIVLRTEWSECPTIKGMEIGHKGLHPKNIIFKFRQRKAYHRHLWPQDPWPPEWYSSEQRSEAEKWEDKPELGLHPL